MVPAPRLGAVAACRRLQGMVAHWPAARISWPWGSIISSRYKTNITAEAHAADGEIQQEQGFKWWH